MNTNSQSGQDVFIKKLLPIDNGTFVDIGCWMPVELNNTLIFEELGWKGVSIDILDMSKEWSVRKTNFIQTDALLTNYTKLFNDFNLPMIIDYLTVDIEGNGHRYKALKKVLESDREFKIITVEHDVYRGFELTEAKPQRELLEKLGYVLVCKNVKCSGNPFEDWWVNPKFIKEENYKHLICEDKEYTEILKKL
jgi:hypothetical protein